MNTTWIVVGHRAGARIFEHKEGALRLVSDVSQEAGRLKSGEINSDGPGRSLDHSPGGHPMSSENNAHDHVALTFAQSIGKSLQKARNEHSFEHLVLVAEPRFLGMLRGVLDKPTAALVTNTVGKDLAHVGANDILSHLKDALPA